MSLPLVHFPSELGWFFGGGKMWENGAFRPNARTVDAIRLKLISVALFDTAIGGEIGWVGASCCCSEIIIG